ncbi:MAG: type II secretion system minor pseudopilin GspJ [Sedimenticola sp.]
MIGKSKTRGFTLLELLVAIAIFATLSLMVFSGLRTLLDSREHTDRIATRLGRLQTAFLFMQQDLSQAVDRETRDPFGDSNPAMFQETGENSLVFVQGGKIGMESERVSLQRIAYQLDEGRLLRLNWPVLDLYQGSKPASIELMDNLSGMEVRFLGEQWYEHWPPQVAEGLDHPLPRAVEVTLTTERWGEVQRVFLVAQ